MEQSAIGQGIIAEKLTALGVPSRDIKTNIASGFEQFAGSIGALQKRRQNNPFFRENAAGGRDFTRKGEVIFPGEGEMLLPRREADAVRGSGVSIEINQTFNGNPDDQTRRQMKDSASELAEEVNRLIRLKKIHV